MNKWGQANALELATPDQLTEMVKHNADANDVTFINKRKQEIWKKVQEATEFSGNEKEQILQTLANGLDDTSIEEISRFASNIERRQKRISQMIGQYFNKLDASQEFFAKRDGYDAIKMYKQEFLRLDEEGKQEWLDKLQEEISERVELHKELAAHVAPEQLSRLRRSELLRMQQYIAESDKIVANNRHLFSPDEIRSLKSQMADFTSHRQQMGLLTKIVEQLETRKWYADIFRRLPANYQKIWGDIGKMSLEQRENGYEKLIVRIEEDYEHTLDNHPNRKHIGAKDRAAALAFVRSEKTSGGEKFRALRDLDRQIMKQKKEVSDPFEENLFKLAKFKSPKDIKTLRDQFYDAPNYQSRKSLMEKVKLTLIETQNESEEVKDLTREYVQELDAALAERIIGHRTYNEAIKQWKLRSLEDKRDVMAMVETDWDRRLKLLKEFLSLPKEIQEKNKGFYEMTHTDRKALLQKIKGEKNGRKKRGTSTPEKDEGREENTESSKEKEIARLTVLASAATRAQKIEEAIDYYEQILELDPKDEIARLNLNFLRKKTDSQEEKSETKEKKLSSSDRHNVKQAAEAAAHTNVVMRRRRRNTVTKYIVDEAKKSEIRHAAHKAKDKTKGLDRRDKLLAQQLYRHTGGSYILQDGEAAKVIWLHEKGLRIKNDESKEAQIEKQVKKEIAESGEKKPYNAIQFYNDSDGVSNATIAAQELEKRDEETRGIIFNHAKKDLVESNTDEEALEKALDEEIQKKDLSVELRAA